MLTKCVDTDLLITELASAGVIVGYSIDHEKITLMGSFWDAMDAPTQAAELALVAGVEAAHAPLTVTEVTLTDAPHPFVLSQELLAVTGVTSVTCQLPQTYPGTLVIRHNLLTVGEQANLTAAALAHDHDAVPTLSVDTAAQVIAADGVATGTVTVTDSRGAGASGLTVRLTIPPGGSAGVDADSFVLDGAGQATATFQATTLLTGELTFEFYYASGEADSVTFTVRRGTA